MGKIIGIVIWIVVIAVIGGGGYFWYARATAVPERNYRTAPVKRGNLIATISATGTVEPEEVVDIGAQVAGRINTFGVDKAGRQIDYGSVVEAETMLAQIDPALYDADLAQSKAQLQVDTAGVAKARADVETLKAKLVQALSDGKQLDAKLQQVQADLRQLNAKVDQSKADLQQSQAKFEQAERDWVRAKKLGPSDALSQEAYDTFKGVYETASFAVTSAKAMISQAEANIASQNAIIAQAEANIVSQKAVVAQARASVLSGEAAIQQAQGVVAHDEAAVKRSQQNLDYCTIKSPVKGIIIDRRVNIGQTVVSSLNAPSLFLLAKDLNRMQVWVSMNEADIGSIKPGQSVSFTIDAFQGRVFKGSVRKIRLNATMTQNVVTYTVEVETDNSSGTLLPYMTASAQFDVAHRDDVLMVPNAALRYMPKPDEIAPDVQQADEEKPAHGQTRVTSSTTTGTKSDGLAKKDLAEKTDSAAKPDAPQRSPVARARVWIKDGNFLRPIRVKTGITDGANTEIKSDELKEDMLVVTGKQAVVTEGDNPKNPFTPQLGRPRSTSSAEPK